VPTLSHLSKYEIRPKEQARSNHSSKFSCIVSDEEKSFITLTAGVSVIKPFPFITDGRTKKASVFST